MSFDLIRLLYSLSLGGMAGMSACYLIIRLSYGRPINPMPVAVVQGALFAIVMMLSIMIVRRMP